MMVSLTGRVHHVLLDVGDGGPGGHTAPGHALPQGGVAQRRGHRGHWTRTDRVLHVQGHQTLPGKDVIVEAIEDVNLEHKQYKYQQTV